MSMHSNQDLCIIQGMHMHGRLGSPFGYILVCYSGKMPHSKSKGVALGISGNQGNLTSQGTKIFVNAI